MKKNISIDCPNCGQTINIAKLLESQIRDDLAKEFEEKIPALTLHLQKQITKKVNDERELQIKSYQAELAEKTERLKAHLKLKAEYDSLNSEFRLLKSKLESDFQNKLDQKVGELQGKIKTDLQKNYNFQLEEKNLLINQLQSEIHNAQRRLDKSSQQMQGESAEVVLEKALRKNFPTDEVAEYKKGEKGADVTLKIINQQGEIAGSIIFESKRTKSFSSGWVEKLKNELRLKKANAAILVTEALPKGWDNAGQTDGIWITTFNEWLILSKVLRESILLLDNVHSMQANRGSKLESIHQFLCGPEFRITVEEILESFSKLKADLEKEKIQITGYWKSREILLERVVSSTSGMYHTVRAILGSKIPEIKLLTTPNGDVSGSK